MRYMRVVAALVVASVLTGAAVAAIGSTAVVKVRATSLGSTLVAANGKTLYMFAQDKSTKSTCSGNCATFWPPLLTTGRPKAGYIIYSVKKCLVFVCDIQKVGRRQKRFCRKVL